MIPNRHLVLLSIGVLFGLGGTYCERMTESLQRVIIRYLQLIIRFRQPDLRGFCMGSHGEQERRSGRCVPHFSKSSRVPAVNRVPSKADHPSIHFGASPPPAKLISISTDESLSYLRTWRARIAPKELLFSDRT